MCLYIHKYKCYTKHRSCICVRLRMHERSACVRTCEPWLEGARGRRSRARAARRWGSARLPRPPRALRSTRLRSPSGARLCAQRGGRAGWRNAAPRAPPLSEIKFFFSQNAGLFLGSENDPFFGVAFLSRMCACVLNNIPARSCDQFSDTKNRVIFRPQKQARVL